MSRQPRSLFDELLELAVYVPAGLASKVLDQIPELADAGRRRVGGQIDQARVIGRFAVGLARSQARRTFGAPARARSRPADAGRETAEAARPRPAPSEPAPRRGEDATATAEPRATTDAEASVEPGHKPTPPDRARRPTPPPRRSSGRDRPLEERPTPPQAIPDYDALSASQVVPRLQGLDREELAAVERYEAVTRGRRTILNRVAQLQRALDER